MSSTINSQDLVRTIAGREIGVKLHDKGFIISTVVFMAVIAAAGILPAVFFGQPSEYRLAHTADTEEIAAAAAELGVSEREGLGLPEANIELVEVDTGVDPREAVTDDVTAVLADVDGRLTLIGDTGVPGDLVTLVTEANRLIEVGAVADQAGLSAEQVQRMTAPEPPAVSLVNAQPDRAVPPELLIFAFGFLFYFTVLTFGMSIAQSVVEEKQSRVVEMLVAAVPVRLLLAGKVIGNTIMALAQVVLIVGVGLIGLQASNFSEAVGDVIAASGWFLGFFLLGFLMLACLWAVAGSLASRIEDLQSTTLVMQIAVMIPFFSAFLVLEPGTTQRVLSYVPLTAPLMMPARVANGTAAPWEPWLAAGIVLLTAALFIVWGARLYAGSVLNTGNRMQLLAAWRRGSVSA